MPSARRQLSQLLDANRVEMLRLALSKTRNFNDAEDVVQTAFLKATRACEAVLAADNPKAYLARIVRNVIVDRFRRSAHLENVSANEHQIEPEVQHDRHYSQEQIEEVRAALAQLPEEHSSILRFHYFHGLSYGAIARLMDSSMPFVKTRMHRARKALAVVLTARLREQNKPVNKASTAIAA